MIKNDLTGKTFGQLDVIKFTGMNKNDSLWLCHCNSCNNQTIIGLNKLKRSTDCGCTGIECRICGKKLGRLNNAHCKIHNITVHEYKLQFPDAETMSKKTRDKIANSIKNLITDEQRIEFGNRAREMWANGTCKGHKMSEKTKEALRRVNVGKKISPENIEATRQRMMGNKYTLGKSFKKTEETREKLSKAMMGNKRMLGVKRPPEVREKHSQTAKQMWADGKLGKFTYQPKWAKELAAWLTSRYIKFRIEYRIPGFRKPYDFFLPDHNLIIELDGCYWHGCPLHCVNCQPPNLSLTIANDEEKNAKAKECGYNLLRIWEHEDVFDKTLKCLESLQ